MKHTEDGAWHARRHEEFGQFQLADAYLHPLQRQDGDSLTETQYLRFNIPQKSMCGLSP